MPFITLCFGEEKEVFIACIWCYVPIIAEEKGLDVTWGFTVIWPDSDFHPFIGELVRKALNLPLETRLSSVRLLFTHFFHLSHRPFWTWFMIDTKGNNTCPFCILECDTHSISGEFIKERALFCLGPLILGYVLSIGTSSVSPQTVPEEAGEEKGEDMMFYKLKKVL